MRRMHIHEPCVITGYEIAQFLERHGMERMAGWVNDIENCRKRDAFLHQKLKDDYTALLERLRKYEPEDTYVAPTGAPPPESSD